MRRSRGLTLAELGRKVGRPAPYLSQLETGKREPRLTLIHALADALGVPSTELLQAEAPSRRSQLEIALERMQDEPLYQSLALPHLKPSARVPDDALEHITALYRTLAQLSEHQPASPESARLANAQLRQDMRARDNYFPEIEAAARDALHATGWRGSGALSEGALLELAAHYGFSIRRVGDLPPQARSVADLAHRTIYIAQRNALPTREARSVILQTLGHFALDHDDPADLGQYLRQRVEANYFAGAILAPEDAIVPFLLEAKSRRDLSIEDLRVVAYLSYEMAAHRFTNLATRHLDIPTHFVRADEEGVVWKAYENDGIPFPSDAAGAIEGQRACRWWGTRTVFDADDTFDNHYQYTETENGQYWDVTHVEADPPPHHAITVGVRAADARWFRGRETDRRRRSQCPSGVCCRQPDQELATRWAGQAWPSPRQPSHVLAAIPVGVFPGVDLRDVYEFVERHSTGPASH